MTLSDTALEGALAVAVRADYVAFVHLVPGVRADRLNTPTRGDVARHQQELKTNPKAELRSTRAIASVNRELALLRRMLNVAQREGWIADNPFSVGESSISLADERKRERSITRDEEKKLLAACDAPKCKHLRAIIICALDTGVRQGEMLKLLASLSS